jgi:hypothetical protein
MRLNVPVGTGISEFNRTGNRVELAEFLLFNFLINRSIPSTLSIKSNPLFVGM